MTEVLLYGEVYSSTAADFIRQVGELTDTDELVVRVNSDGGDPQYGFGMSAKYAEFKGKKSVKVDGRANSTGLFFICTTKDVEALDASLFTIHRAAYPSWVESSEEYFTESMRATLESVNKSLRDSFESKVDVEKFEKMKGVKVEDIFSMDSRIDVVLTAQEAKKIGLVSKLTPLTSDLNAKIKSNIQSFSQNIAARFDVGASNEVINVKPNNKIMNLETLKAEHPALFAQVLALGAENGVKAERDRVGAWTAFNDVDSKAVTDGIKSGENISQTAMAEFSIKMHAKVTTAKVEADAAGVVTTETPVTAELTEVQKIEAMLNADLSKN